MTGDSAEPRSVGGHDTAMNVEPALEEGENEAALHALPFSVPPPLPRVR